MTHDEVHPIAGVGSASGPAAVAVVMTIATLAAGQPSSAVSTSSTSQPGRSQVQPQPVEQGVGDLNPLQTSSRLVPIDLRQPSGWERVYRLSGDPSKNGGAGLFARISGGIAAVFPWSTYELSSRGRTVATVPPGTTYYIGGVPKSLMETAPASTEKAFNYQDLSARPGSPDRPAQQADNSIQTSARPVLRGEAVVERAVQAPVQTSIWTSESYRQARLDELLTRASPK